MLQKFTTHIHQNFPFFFGKKILIAISGGVDSVVLAHLCTNLSKINVSLAHCNFKLRGEASDLDEFFVKSIGEKLGIETFTTQFDTKKIAKQRKTSTQITARELRYHWFEKLSQEQNFDYILTAHHLNDSLETFIINFSRGSGLKGLTGIPSANGNIFRPLLIFTRDELKNYAVKNAIEWREDASNSETKYLRNKIRHEIVPKLKELNPSLLEAFKNTLTFLQESQEIIEDRTAEVAKKITTKKDGFLAFDIQKIKQLSNPKAYLYQLLKPYGFTEWNDVSQLLSAQSGKQVFSKTHRLLKNRDYLLLTENKHAFVNNNSETFEISSTTTSINKPLCLNLESNFELKSEKKNSRTIIVDKDLLNYPLIVRKLQKGDYFCPTGMQGRKKLSKYFKDEKFSLLEKEQIWLLCTAKNEIIWVIEKRQDRRFLPTEQTNNLLKITIN